MSSRSLNVRATVSPSSFTESESLARELVVVVVVVCSRSPGRRERRSSARQPIESYAAN